MASNHNIGQSNGRQTPSARHKFNRIFVGQSLAVILCPASNGKLFAATVDLDDLDRVMAMGHWRTQRQCANSYLSTALTMPPRGAFSPMKTTSGQDATRPRNLTAEENNSNAIDILLDGRPIATVIDEDGDDVTAEMRELAGLFVAAPEMRDLLEAIQFHNRSKIQAWREKYGYDFPDYAATSDMARKAIDLVLAKAGGQ